ncbi:hypothetical protein [Streptomyces sp. NPDC002758]
MDQGEFTAVVEPAAARRQARVHPVPGDCFGFAVAAGVAGGGLVGGVPGGRFGEGEDSAVLAGCARWPPSSTCSPTSPNADRVRHIEEQLRQARSQNRALTDLVQTYAAVINDLAEELEAVTKERNAALTARDGLLTKVTVFTQPPTAADGPSARRG